MTLRWSGAAVSRRQGHAPVGRQLDRVRLGELPAGERTQRPAGDPAERGGAHADHERAHRREPVDAARWQLLRPGYVGLQAPLVALERDPMAFDAASTAATLRAMRSSRFGEADAAQAP